MQLALTEPQEEFVFCKAKYPAMVAGLGAGKSQAGIGRLLVKMLNEPGIDTSYYMPTYDLLNLRAIPGAEQQLDGLGIAYTTNKKDYAIRIHGYGSMIFRSYDRPERIVAYEVAHSILDELDTLPKDKAALVWRKVSERTRQECKGHNTIGNVTTPDQGYSGFTYAKWEKARDKDHVTIRAKTTSNPFLPDGYVEQIRSNYDPILADMYINGEYVSLSQNKVYHQFDRNKHHTDRVIKPKERLQIGLDFNIGGVCATVWVTENNHPTAVDEFVSHDTGDFIINLERYKGHPLTVFPDASGKNRSTNASLSDIAMIIKAGYIVDAPDGNPAIRDRVNAMNGLMAHNRFKINTTKCPELTDALEMQGYDKRGYPEKFTEHPAIDDWTDCAGYFINMRWPIVRGGSSVGRF